MEIGHVIKRLRTDKGWSQEELAHRVGMSTANLSRIETGRHGVSLERTAQLASQLGFKVFELFALAENIAPTSLSKKHGVVLSKDEESLIAAYRRMSRERQALVRATAEEFAKPV